MLSFAKIPKINSELAVETTNVQSSKYDGLVLIYSNFESLKPSNLSAPFAETIKSYASIDDKFGQEVALIADSTAVGGRLVLTPTGSLYDDVDDVRRFADAAQKATVRAIEAGIRKPLYYFADKPNSEDYVNFVQVSLLGILDAAFEQITFREHRPKTWSKIDEIGIVLEGLVEPENISKILEQVEAIEAGKRIAKDLGSPDPERMTPSNFTNYIREVFETSENIELTVIEDIVTIEEEYPLLHAVTRASLAVKRHHPRIVKIEYKSPDQSQVKENLFFVGKGVTYDTGGADIKAGGRMRGMSRDKCGAATVAGFLKTVSKLQPVHVNVTAALALVRNSVGSGSYVSDEVIYSRARVRVLVNNTDAEGRMIMTDLLSEFKDLALKNTAIPSRLFTVATLTGHACLSHGYYGAVIDNGPARKAGISQRIIQAGHIWGDPFELSMLRREDYELITPSSNREDVIQSSLKPSIKTFRGHQYPAAFMIVASGLKDHGLKALKEKQISYSHLDIAGNAEAPAKGLSLPEVTGNPVAALAGAFL
ncbi:11916_t:CDS:2 [Ambispora gerdemannii]|uniref:11916_t:CDS:1 n=1 Tax=Ambispora gerdemannii TaxID=144530 RepID=A0A9N9CD25_9GLOM|nr:11916_t:CDS:2 [Ambispora gerdemannii]